MLNYYFTQNFILTRNDEYNDSIKFNKMKKRNKNPELVKLSQILLTIFETKCNHGLVRF